MHFFNLKYICDAISNYFDTLGYVSLALNRHNYGQQKKMKFRFILPLIMHSRLKSVLSFSFKVITTDRSGM